MKRYLLLTGFLCGVLYSSAQEYSVIHVLGKIYDSKTKAYLAPGSRLDATSALRFETPDAKAAVLSPAKGRLILQRTSGGDNQSDLVYTLAGLITPVKGKLSSRAGGINNVVDFVNRFGDGNTAWIGDTYTAVVSPLAYPMDEKRFFFVRYLYRGEVINKRLDSRGDTLIFERKRFYSVDSAPVEPSETSEHALHYYDAATGKAIRLTALSFVSISDDEFGRLAAELKGFDGEDKIDVLREVITGLYGSVSDSDIISALRRIGK